MSYQEALRKSFSEPAVVLVTSKTCGPCKSMKPIIERLALELAFPLFILDAAENMATVRELGLRTVPTTLVLKGGEVTDTIAGGQTEMQLLRALFKNAVTQISPDFEHDVA